VVHDVDLVHELVHDRAGEHRVDDEVETVVLAEMRDVLVRPCREIVERPHGPSVREQQLAEVRADEPCAAGDERAAAVRLACHGAGS
jgi:hypothetical protein